MFCDKPNNIGIFQDIDQISVRPTNNVNAKCNDWGPLKPICDILYYLLHLYHIPEHANYRPARMKFYCHAIFGHLKCLKIKNG